MCTNSVVSHYVLVFARMGHPEVRWLSSSSSSSVIPWNTFLEKPILAQTVDEFLALYVIRPTTAVFTTARLTFPQLQNCILHHNNALSHTSPSAKLLLRKKETALFQPSLGPVWTFVSRTADFLQNTSNLQRLKTLNVSTHYTRVCNIRRHHCLRCWSHRQLLFCHVACPKYLSVFAQYSPFSRTLYTTSQKQHIKYTGPPAVGSV